MARPDGYGGFQMVRVGAITHDFIKHEAYARGLSIHEFIIESAQSYTGRKMEGRALMPEAVVPSILDRVTNAINAMDAKLDAFIAPKGKRSLSDDVSALDSWVWHRLGLNSTAEDIAELKNTLRRIEAKHAGQQVLREGSVA